MPHQLIAGSDCSWYALFDAAALEPFHSNGATECWQAWPTAAGVAILIAVVASLALWALTRSPRAIRFRTVESEIEKRYPSTVVMLNRLADDAIPATFPPARLGDDGGGGNGGGSNRGAA
jgi:hypothetical protein